MKIQIGVEPGTSYTFSPQSGSDAFLLVSGVDIKKNNVLTVINITKGVVAMMCNKSVPEYDIEEATNIIWLLSDVVSTFEASDQFMILMEVESSFKDQALLESVHLLRKMVNLLESSGNVDSSNRQRVAIDNSVQIAVSAASGIGNVGMGYPTSYSCTVGAVSPYSITAAQPAQLVATIIDQRIDLECKMRMAADCMRTKLSWT